MKLKGFGNVRNTTSKIMIQTRLGEPSLKNGQIWDNVHYRGLGVKNKNKMSQFQSGTFENPGLGLNFSKMSE